MTRHRAVGMVSALIVALLTESCTAIHTVPIQRAGAFVGIAAGDRLTVTTRDGRDHEIRVRTVQPDMLTDADGVVYRFTDVLMVQRRELDRRKNVILVSVLAPGLVIAVIAIATGGYIPTGLYLKPAHGRRTFNATFEVRASASTLSTSPVQLADGTHRESRGSRSTGGDTENVPLNPMEGELNA